MALTTTLSRIFGLGRTVLLAHLLGLSWLGDAFFIAFLIPNLFRRLFAEGAMSTSFIPLFSEIRNRRGGSVLAQIFFSRILWLFALTLLIVCVLGSVFSEWIVRYFFILRKDEGLIVHTALLLKITFPYLLFICCAAILQGLLNAHQKFVVPAMTSIWFNFSVIATAVYCYAFKTDLISTSIFLSASIFMGGVLQLISQVPSVLGIDYSLKPRFSGMNREVRRFFTLMAPVTLFAGVYQLNHLLVNPIAISLGKGTVSALEFSRRLQELPLGIFVVSMATVNLPRFSNYGHAGMEKIGEETGRHIRLLFFVLVPVVITALFEVEKIVELIFASGKFGQNEVFLTAECFKYHLLGILPIGVSRLFQTVFYARQDTRTPLWIGCWTVAANFLAALFLTGVFSMGGPGIALASFLSQSLMAFLLYIKLYRIASLRFESIFWLKLLLAAAFLGGALFFIKENHLLPGRFIFDGLLVPSFWKAKLVSLLDLTAISIAAFFLFLAAGRSLGLKESSHLIRFIKKRFSRKPRD